LSFHYLVSTSQLQTMISKIITNMHNQCHCTTPNTNSLYVGLNVPGAFDVLVSRGNMVMQCVQCTLALMQGIASPSTVKTFSKHCNSVTHSSCLMFFMSCSHVSCCAVFVLYQSYCHGALKLDPVRFVCKYFFFENILNLYGIYI